MAIAATYKGYRYPIEVIGHAVWLYHRFALSLRDVEELMLARGVVVTYETIRSWCARFGPDYANKLRRRRPRPGDKWHLDEVFVKINGTTHYLWRAVDQHGNVLDILVQSRRNAVAAKRFFRKLLKGLRYVPRVIVTDKLASYQVAQREFLPSVTHRRWKYLNIYRECRITPPATITGHRPSLTRQNTPTTRPAARRHTPPDRSYRCLRSSAIKSSDIMCPSTAEPGVISHGRGSVRGLTPVPPSPVWSAMGDNGPTPCSVTP